MPVPIPMLTAERRRAGGLRWAVLTLWLVMLLAGFGFAGLTAAFQNETCYRDGSGQGRFSWSLLPPGHVCTWRTVPSGLGARQGPGTRPSVYLAVMAVTGLALVKWRPPKTERLRASIFEPDAEPA
jgi:hypothetical protein